jgi:DDE family transposase
MTSNNGWVNVGTDHDTAEFAVESIRRWWIKMGQKAYPNVDRLLITADGGVPLQQNEKNFTMFFVFDLMIFFKAKGDFLHFPIISFGTGLNREV